MAQLSKATLYTGLPNVMVYKVLLNIHWYITPGGIETKWEPTKPPKQFKIHKAHFFYIYTMLENISRLTAMNEYNNKSKILLLDVTNLQLVG